MFRYGKRAECLPAPVSGPLPELPARPPASTGRRFLAAHCRPVTPWFALGALLLLVFRVRLESGPRDRGPAAPETA